MIIAVDFDGTIVTHRFPRIGAPLPGALETLRDLVAQGHKLLLWTCRENVGYNISKQYLKDAVAYLENNGVELFGANETPLAVEFREDCELRRKVHADCYIDDRNLGGFPGWDAVRKHFDLPPLSDG